MNIADLVECLEERGLRLTLINSRHNIIDKCISDEILDTFIRDIENKVSLELELNGNIFNIQEVIDTIQYDLDTWRIENTQVGCGNAHNRAVMETLEHAYKSVNEHLNKLGGK